MKIKQLLYRIVFSLVLCGISVFGTTGAAEAQQVHALLVILGNDINIRESVKRNESHILKMLNELSEHADVKLTLMKSISDIAGQIQRTTLADGAAGTFQTTEQGIIAPKQMVAWLQALKPNNRDTIFIYYSGHGEIDEAFDTHFLEFDDRFPPLDRGRLSQMLKQKPARLRILITDTCSEIRQDLSKDIVHKFSIGVRQRARQAYTKHLFLEHKGFLDMTAAARGQVALGTDNMGGFFTSALVAKGFTAAADVDKKDDFLSWAEAFEKTSQETDALFQKVGFNGKQKTQKPVLHSLPDPAVGDATVEWVDTVKDALKQSTETGKPIMMHFYTDWSRYCKLLDAETFTDANVILLSKKFINIKINPEDEKKPRNEKTGEKYGVKSYPTILFVSPDGGVISNQLGFLPPEKFAPVMETALTNTEMVLIPAGEFQMGSNDGDDNEKPVHTVYVDAFYMDKYEVTNAQYKRFVDANPEWRKDRINKRFHSGGYLKRWNGNNYPAGEADHPVVYVSWYAAMAYAEWAGKRLPTEAEWEKAARGGLKGQKYPWGNAIDPNKANYDENVDDTTPVGSYAANGYGLYDMAGNVWEWCLDESDENFYSGSPVRNPIAGADITDVIQNYTNVKSSRILRGGSWFNSERFVRVADRFNNTPTYTTYTNGFRCARAVSP